MMVSSVNGSTMLARKMIFVLFDKVVLISIISAPIFNRPGRLLRVSHDVLIRVDPVRTQRLSHGTGVVFCGHFETFLRISGSMEDDEDDDGVNVGEGDNMLADADGAGAGTIDGGESGMNVGGWDDGAGVGGGGTSLIFSARCNFFRR